jgi:hypothetical protein
VPKTYNQRQINHIRAQDSRAPWAEAGPDVTRFIRFFHPDDVRQIADRMEQRVAAGKLTRLKPETAYLVVKALRTWNATPKREAIVREICGIPGGCEKPCLNCTGKANAIMHLYEGAAARK